MKKKKSGSGGANWMDTYGDMVTLLLCFFVMLYSMSTMDQKKWEQIVESFNPSEQVDEIIQSVEPVQPPMTSQMTQEEVDQDLEKLYQSIKQYIEQEGLSNQVSVGKGSGYVFISFDDTVFFNGDSYVLLDAGKQILDKVALSISEVSESINEIRALGHTAQAKPDELNTPSVDRFLASNRATVVTVYLQEKNVIDPARLVSVGYGQWRPVSDNNSSQGRAKNRRVELIVTGLDLDEENGDDITQYYTMFNDMESDAQ